MYETKILRRQFEIKFIELEKVGRFQINIGAFSYVNTRGLYDTNNSRALTPGYKLIFFFYLGQISAADLSSFQGVYRIFGPHNMEQGLKCCFLTWSRASGNVDYYCPKNGNPTGLCYVYGACARGNLLFFFKEILKKLPLAWSKTIFSKFWGPKQKFLKS